MRVLGSDDASDEDSGSDDDSEGDSDDDGNGEGLGEGDGGDSAPVPLTSSSLDGSWDSSCVANSDLSETGLYSYYDSLTFVNSGGFVNWTRRYHTSSNCANGTVKLYVEGNCSSFVFNQNSGNEAYTHGGGTCSIGPGNATVTFPALNQVIDNVVSISGNTMTLGAFATNAVGPGVFDGDAVNTSSTFTLTKQ